MQESKSPRKKISKQSILLIVRSLNASAEQNLLHIKEYWVFRLSLSPCETYFMGIINMLSPFYPVQHCMLYLCKSQRPSEPSGYRCPTSLLPHPNFLKEWSLPASSISSALPPSITLRDLTSFPTTPQKLRFQRFTLTTVKAKPMALSLSS